MLARALALGEVIAAGLVVVVVTLYNLTYLEGSGENYRK